MFGNNASGLLGISKTDDIQKYPQRVLAGKSKSTTMYLENIVSIAAGAHHMLALDKNGSVWAWGDNSRGQLGEGTYEDVLEADGTKTSATTRTIPVAVDIQDVERFMQDIIILRQLRQTVLHGHGAITVTVRWVITVQLM